MNDTIVAISTPIGVSAISIVRICGKKSTQIAQTMSHLCDIKPRYAYLSYIYNAQNNIIDRAIVLYFKAPHSFNGEDIIEFQCHGGIMVAKNILDTCIAHGARLAQPGEFSKRALLNGKMDLAMCENISQLILAQSAQAAEILARNLSGELGAIINEVRENLINILASIEALIDYSEDDLPLDLEREIRTNLESGSAKLARIFKHSLSIQNIIDGHRLIIIGKPNVGKSSILNRLLLQERAIVSPIAGTTRDLISENITIANQIIKIIDTAGIRKGGEEIEKIGIERTRAMIKDASIIVAVFDLSAEFGDEDAEICEILAQNKSKIHIAVLNKMDAEKKFDEARVADFQSIKISSLDESVFILRDWIEKQVAQNPLNDESVALTNTRQLECAQKCLEAIASAQQNPRELEICAFHINCALRELELLSQPFYSNEVLDKMFSNFCLGK